jgi:hypothetical protein
MSCLEESPRPLLARACAPVTKERFDEAEYPAVGGSTCGGCGARCDVARHGGPGAESDARYEAPRDARRDLVWAVQRRVLGHIHTSLDAARFEPARIDHAVEATWQVRHHRQRERQSHRFGAVAAGTTYTGAVSGKSMSGSYKTPQGGGKWSALKTS